MGIDQSMEIDQLSQRKRDRDPLPIARDVWLRSDGAMKLVDGLGRAIAWRSLNAVDQRTINLNQSNQINQPIKSIKSNQIKSTNQSNQINQPIKSNQPTNQINTGNAVNGVGRGLH